MTSHETFQEYMDRRSAHEKQQFDEAVKKAEAEKAALKAQLLAPESVEGFVASGRAPFFVGRVLSGSEQTESFHYELPPEGFQPGDKLSRIPGGPYNCITPEGKIRGHMRSLWLTHEEHEILGARLEAALKPQPRTR